MVGIKIYQTDDILNSYLRFWKNEDKKTFSSLREMLGAEYSSVDKMILFLEEKITENIEAFIQTLKLPKERTLALAHLIYIEEKIFEDIDVFFPKNKKEELNQRLIKAYSKYALPTIYPSQMMAQTIRIYNPFRRIWIFIKKVKHYVFRKK